MIRPPAAAPATCTLPAAASAAAAPVLVPLAAAPLVGAAFGPRVAPFALGEAGSLMDGLPSDTNGGGGVSAVSDIATCPLLSCVPPAGATFAPVAGIAGLAFAAKASSRANSEAA